MKKILITGAGGFIGSHLTEKCVELGYKVKALIRYNSRNNLGWLDHSKHKDEIEIISGDIRDFDSVFRAMKNVAFSKRVHLSSVQIFFWYKGRFAPRASGFWADTFILKAEKPKGIS
ncbi:MAG: SDR family NAD(P)-dependent oxidoreductase [Candidatus Heimdallarchaeota archaeon]|nr:SDR family NAD(P)-dependent oxidoreductase [Candidatus Heimdallarchaeota archaeon]